MKDDETVVTDLNDVLFSEIPISSGNAVGAFACTDYPGDTTQRITLYVDYFTLIVEEGKLCGNWSTLPGNACSIKNRRFRVIRDHITMMIEYPCPNGSKIFQVEFGMSEPMTKVYPIYKGAVCGINGEGNMMKVRNRDESRRIEIDVEIDSVPDPSNRYPQTNTIALNPGELYELGCSEQNQSSIVFRLIDARFI